MNIYRFVFVKFVLNCFLEIWSANQYLILGGSIILILLLIIVLIFTSYKISIKIRKHKKHMIDSNFNSVYKTKNMSDLNINDFDCSFFTNDIMEIERKNIKLLSDILGEGAFGLVRKGLLIINDDSSTEINVAVKMLKGLLI